MAFIFSAAFVSRMLYLVPKSVEDILMTRACGIFAVTFSFFALKQFNERKLNTSRNEIYEDSGNMEEESESTEVLLPAIPNLPRKRQQSELDAQNSLSTNRKSTQRKEVPCDSLQGSFCVICLENESCFAAYPCGHMCLCGVCVKLMRQSHNEKHCPVCRCNVADYMRIYG